MRIVLGADHGGWRMKEEIKSWLREDGYKIKDVGAAGEIQGDDYVDYAVLVADELEKAGPLRGVLFCRNGFGMVIAANRFAGVRCGFGFDVEAVRKGRTDDEINCLAIPADYVDLDQVKKMMEVFLKTEFSGEERYKRRLLKLGQIR